MKLVTKIHSLFIKPKPKRKYVKRVPMASAWNDAGERIESLRFSVPALRVGVLEYAPGQLTTNNAELDGKTVKLYYPPESVSNKKFLKSLETAPVVVGGHDSTTNEHNKKIDGWAHTVNYDEMGRCAMIAGVVKGNKEVAYIKGNLGEPDFGASAFVDIYNLVIESGTTPDGQAYDAIAKDLKATHVALAPHVRDPENKIQLLNTVVINTDGKYNNNEVKKMDLTSEQIAAIVENAVSKAVTTKNDGDRLEKLEKAVASLANTVETLVKNQEEAEEEKKEEAEAENKKGKAKNEDGESAEDEKEEATLENTKPSQILVAAFSSAYNADFQNKTPSFKTLAQLAGIKEDDDVLRITAVNAKFAELEAGKKKTESVSTGGVF